MDYKELFENKDPESTVINDMEDESGVEIGSCPFPDKCKEKHCNDGNCFDCQALETWWNKFRAIVDDLIFKFNVHTCRGQKSDEKAVKKDRPGCINKHRNCKARFPR